ncbi:hypothetical protein BDW22DRAFT_1363052 [Trametopsis cervina]|nr:hypothetical protein BDW22DRAFT_1363052 [Trametopsis cervina]
MSKLALADSGGQATPSSHSLTSSNPVSFADFSSLHQLSGSEDANITDCARSLMTFVRELYEDFPTLESPSGFLSADSVTDLPAHHPALQQPHISEDNVNEDSRLDLKADDDVLSGIGDILYELEVVAGQIIKLAIPRPLSLSPARLSHAQDEHIDSVKTKHSPTHYRHESGYVSGSSSPSLGLLADYELTLRYPLRSIGHHSRNESVSSFGHSPRSPQDIPLPHTPVNTEFMSTSYDSSSSSRSYRQKFTTGIKDMLLRQRQSSPVVPTFASSDQTVPASNNTGCFPDSYRRDVASERANRPAHKSDLRRFKSLLFKEAVDDNFLHVGYPGEPGVDRGVVSFLEF